MSYRVDRAKPTGHARIHALPPHVPRVDGIKQVPCRGALRSRERYRGSADRVLLLNITKCLTKNSPPSSAASRCLIDAGVECARSCNAAVRVAPYGGSERAKWRLAHIRVQTKRSRARASLPETRVRASGHPCRHPGREIGGTLRRAAPNCQRSRSSRNSALPPTCRKGLPPR